MTKEQQRIIRAIRAVSKKEKGILFCYLFGSFAYGKTNSQSDVDIAVYLDPRRCKDFFETRLILMEKFSRKTGKDVEVIILNDAAPFMKYVVIQEGITVFEVNKPARFNFELKALNEYFDFKPFMDRYEQKILTS